MKHHDRPERPIVMTPESAVWLLYAGLVQGIRWRRHLACSPGPLAVPAARPPRGPAGRSPAVSIRGR